jgi:hypothetical protein
MIFRILKNEDPEGDWACCLCRNTFRETDVIDMSVEHQTLAARLSITGDLCICETCIKHVVVVIDIEVADVEPEQESFTITGIEFDLCPGILYLVQEEDPNGPWPCDICRKTFALAEVNTGAAGLIFREDMHLCSECTSRTSAMFGLNLMPKKAGLKGVEDANPELTQWLIRRLVLSEQGYDDDEAAALSLEI